MNPLRGPVLWVTERPVVRNAVAGWRIGQAVAGRFVAGPELDDGIAVAKELRDRGLTTILDHLGENVETPEQAGEATDDYVLALLAAHRAIDVDCCVSVKLTQLGLDSSTALCLANMQRVLEVAAEADPPTLVMIDMEARAYVDATLEIYTTLRERFPNVGVAIQSYLHRTAADVAAIAGPNAIVRMVKGAYLEPPEAAYQQRREVTRSFVRCSRALLDAGATVHFATHDARLIAGARDYVRSSGVPRDRYEFQFLYGIRRDLQARLVDEGEPVRVYVPYGTQWYPYLTRRLAERPANMWFFASNALRWRG